MVIHPDLPPEGSFNQSFANGHFAVKNIRYFFIGNHGFSLQREPAYFWYGELNYFWVKFLKIVANVPIFTQKPLEPSHVVAHGFSIVFFRNDSCQRYNPYPH
jgi:hypothetical protein